ncbi:hypothetical protein BCR33DRAFT_718902 [Rhizoclosmatium globosum]|uniref:Uncharacterized protein n=1 Tax=Rhizoclosmatium globosum TaxID=329046 RepID=A0A1Y2C2Z3_9FUNG|nr:hypothetical protein BCR33DRAFT_718902 [Rhizoclosmatium globosum]|eukprot:ORY41254.1 hypothetical protein BCR33DRAFT_718902 [Rhizoclosmatium globosum]
MVKQHSGLQKDVLSIYRQLLKTASSAISKASGAVAPQASVTEAISPDLRKKLNVYSAIRTEFRINKFKIAGNSHAAIEHLVVKRMNEGGMDGISLPDNGVNMTGRKKWA